METEVLNVYDCGGNLISKMVQRGTEALKENEYIMLSVVFIKNDKDQFLIQKTSEERGSLFSTTGGHVRHKETPVEAIIREIQEELGMTVLEEQVTFINRTVLENKPCIFNVFYLEMNANVNSFVLQEDEVAAVLWLNRLEITELIENNQFLQSHGLLFDYIK